MNASSRARLVDRSAAIELQRRGLAAFVRLLARGSASSTLFERDGVLGAIVPACPDRSVINSVAYRDAGSLAAALEELAAAHDAAGVRAWTVWVPEGDREAAAALEAAGHRLDATPAAMSLDLARLPEPEPGGLDWDDRAPTPMVARINDLAYGFEEPDLRHRGDRSRRPEPPLRLYQAREDGEPVSVLGDDRRRRRLRRLPRRHRSREHRGKGLARRLLHAALAEARDRGLRTSTPSGDQARLPRV